MVMDIAPAGRVLVAEDDPLQRRLIGRILEHARYSVAVAADGGAAWDLLRVGFYDVVLVDLDMPVVGGNELLERVRRFDPDLPVIVLSGLGSVAAAVRSIQLGAHDYVEKPFDPVRLQAVVGHAVQLRSTTMRARAAERAQGGFRGILGDSAPIRILTEQIRRVARYDVPVLVLGESGTGKELVAAAIHAESPRSGAPFVPFNAAAVTETLFESALFGHARGAFTGAVTAHRGLMEEADHGTLMLDEIGDMAVPNQVKLLRALESGEVRPVGGTGARKVDVRLVACTNANLRQRIQEGTFRADLFYRLRGVVLELPPLRSRPEDIALLATEFLGRARQRYGLTLRGFDGEALQALQAYPWPGNVRELMHTVGSAALLATGAWIGVADLPKELLPAPGAALADAAASEDLRLDTAEKRHVRRVLALTRGNRTRTAELLGTSRQSMYRLLTRHGLE